MLECWLINMEGVGEHSHDFTSIMVETGLGRVINGY